MSMTLNKETWIMDITHLDNECNTPGVWSLDRLLGQDRILFQLTSKSSHA